MPCADPWQFGFIVTFCEQRQGIFYGSTYGKPLPRRPSIGVSNTPDRGNFSSQPAQTVTRILSERQHREESTTKSHAILNPELGY